LSFLGVPKTLAQLGLGRVIRYIPPIVRDAAATPNADTP